MPALTAIEAREKAFPLTADDLEAIIDCKIASKVETGIGLSVFIDDKDLERGYFVADFVRHPRERAHPILREVVSRFEAAGYTVQPQAATPFTGDYLAHRSARIEISWGL